MADRIDWPELTPEQALHHFLNRLECFAKQNGLTPEELEIILNGGIAACSALRPDIGAKFKKYAGEGG